MKIITAILIAGSFAVSTPVFAQAGQTSTTETTKVKTKRKHHKKETTTTETTTTKTTPQ